MATIYSNVYSSAAITNNISYRVKIDYTTSMSGSEVTASGTVSLQAKGTFSGSVSSMYKYVKGIVKLSSIAPSGSGVAWGDTVGETANQTRTATSYSSWTTLKSASFSGSEIRLSSDRTVYIYGAIQFIDADATTSRGLYGIGPYGSILVPAQETYTLTYRANGGASGDFTETYSSAYTYFISSRTGYRDNAAFVNWNTASDGTGTSYLPYSSFTTSSDVTFYAIWVAVPQITDISAIRSDSSGNPDDEGSYALLSATWNIDPTIDPNASASVTGTCTPQGGSSFPVTLTGDTSGAGGTVEALIPNMDTNQQYSFTITVANGQKCSGALLVANETSRTVIMSRAFFIMDFAAGGHGLGVGRAAPANGLEIGYPTVFDNDVSSLEDISAAGNLSGATLSTTGNATVGGDVAATGALSGATLDTSGDAYIGGNLIIGDSTAGHTTDSVVSNGSKYSTIYDASGSPVWRFYISSSGSLARQQYSNGAWGTAQYFIPRESIAGLFVTEAKSATIGQISASGTKWVTVTCSKTGYTLIGPMGWYINGAAGLTIYNLKKSSATTCSVAFRNPTSSASSATATIEISALFMRSSW